MKTIRMVKPVSVGLLTIAAFCFTPAITARGGTTYLFVGADSRGNYQDVKNWQDAAGNSPTYAPTDANCNPDDTYVVKDGKRTRDEGAGYANMQIYGRVVYGEIGGTAGYHTEESQYPRSLGAKIDFCHPDGVTFANGAYTANNSATSEEWGNRVMGKITITAPATAPFVFTTSNSTDGRYIYFENSFESLESAGMKFDDSGRGNWQFKGSLSDYRGSMTFAKPGSTVLFGTDSGTIDLDALSFASSMTVTVENVSAPLKAKTLTLGDGTVFNLSAGTEGDDLSVASLEAESLALEGAITLRIASMPRIPCGVSEVRLVTVKQGTLDVSKFSLDIAGSGARHCKGLRVDETEEGTALVAVFEHPGLMLLVK